MYVCIWWTREKRNNRMQNARFKGFKSVSVNYLQEINVLHILAVKKLYFFNVKYWVFNS